MDRAVGTTKEINNSYISTGSRKLFISQSAHLKQTNLLENLASQYAPQVVSSTESTFMWNLGF